MINITNLKALKVFIQANRTNCIQYCMKIFRPKKSYFTDIMCAVDHEEANLKLKKLKNSEGLDIELSYDGLKIDFNY